MKDLEKLKEQNPVVDEANEVLQDSSILRESDFDVLNSKTIENIKASFNQDDDDNPHHNLFVPGKIW